MSKTKEFELARQARDARELYESSKPGLTAGLVSMDEFMSRKSDWRKKEVAMRRAIKRGSYRNIEQDLKAKYGK